MGDIFGKVAYSKASKIDKITDLNSGYNIKNGLKKWRLSTSRLESGIAETINVSVLGDSFTQGNVGLTNTIENCDKGYFTRLNLLLRAKYGDVGDGFIYASYPWAAAVGKWSYTGTWRTFGGYGWIYSSPGNKTTIVAGSTATLVFTGTDLKILAESASSGLCTVSVVVDGGAPTTWNTFGTPTVIKEFSISGLADAEHTVVITFDSTGTFQLLGAYVVKGTTGIRMNKFGAAGATIENFTNSFNQKACIEYWTPKLTILECCYNDWNTQVSLDLFQSRFQTLITKALTYGDVLILTLGSHHEIAEKTIPMVDYYNTLKTLADTNNVALFDLHNRWGSTYAEASSYLADGVHPYPEGHQDIAKALYKILTD